MKALIFFYSILSTATVFASYTPMVVSDIAVMQKHENGTYSVYCNNGNHETITDLDLKLGNACPNLTSSEPTEILSMQNRGDGSFDVVCRDLKRLVATAEQVMAGGICAPPIPKIVIEDGVYVVASGYSSYCKQRITAAYKDNELSGVKVEFMSPCTMVREFSCSESICINENFKIEITQSDSYKFTRSGRDLAVFKKSK